MIVTLSKSANGYTRLVSLAHSRSVHVIRLIICPALQIKSFEQLDLIIATRYISCTRLLSKRHLYQ